MSAADKLRKLEPFRAEGWDTFEWYQEKAKILVDALPELIAVVEAAEQDDGPEHWRGLGDALLALEEKLS